MGEDSQKHATRATSSSQPSSSRQDRSETSFLLEQALFASYASNGSVLPEEDEESLPSLSIEVPPSLSQGSPPSPIVARPSNSILFEQEEDTDFLTVESSRRNPPQQQQQQLVEQSESSPMEQQPTPSSDKPPPLKEQEQKVQIPDHPASFYSQSDRDRNRRPPPMQEVLLNNDEETFFEDRSLEQRTQRTLVTTPVAKSSPDHDTLVSTARHSPLSTVQSSPLGSLPQQHQPQSEQLPRRQHPQEDTTELQRDASLYSSGDFSLLQVLIRMKEELARAHEKLKTIEQANQLLAGERDSLSRQLEAQQANEQAHVTELKVNLSRQQGVLDTLRSQKEEWQLEKGRFDEKVRVAAREKKDLMHKRLASDNRQKELKLQLDHVQGQLTAVMAEKTTMQEDNGRLRQEMTSLAKANSELQQKLSTILEQDVQAVQSREEAEQETKARQEENEAHQRELERLQQALEETKQTYKEDQESLHEKKLALETALRTTEEKLQQVNESTQQEIETLQKSVHESKETIQHLRSSQAALRASGGTSSLGRVVGGGLRSATFGTVNTNSHHALNSVRFEKEGLPTTTGGSSVSSTNTSLKNVASFDPSSITERLARIRDSSERAALIRTYTREIARLKEENEATAKNLEASHSEALHRARKHADLKLETRLHELKTSLSQEYDEKLEELESRHRQQVTELKEEAHRDKELGDESLRAAMSKLTEIIQQHEKETARRKALERTMEHLQFEFEDEKKRLATRSAVELRKRRAEWEEERSSLLTIIQRECNSVFERKRNNFAHDQQQTTASSRAEGDVGVSNLAPLVVDTSRGDSLGDLPGKNPSPLNVVGSARSTASTARLISPTFSDFESVLRETEELVQGLF